MWKESARGAPRWQAGGDGPNGKKAEALVRRVLRSRSSQEARFAVLRKGNSLEAIC